MLNAVRPPLLRKGKPGRGPRTTRLRIAAAVAILAFAASMTVASAMGQTLPSLSQYGVVRIYASMTFSGRAQITIASKVTAPFFLSGLTLFLGVPAASNIILNTINIDNTGAIQLSGSGSAPSAQVVIVASGLTYGDIVQSMPNYLSFLMMKDPLGNNAIAANGGSSGGIVITIASQAGAYGASTTLLATATVVAPSTTTVTMTMN